MNIVGEGLPSSIGNQIDIRQRIYGSINRTTEEILYLNSRTAFVKAVSSVNIENYNTDSIKVNRPELASVLSQYGGDSLARNFILFNGTSAEGGTLKAGIPQNLLTGANQYVNNLAYGLGGLESGIRPMPGIVSMQTTSKGTYGSVEETLLKIKAWNRIQFEIIDILYLRLGYSVLIEWGNTSYFDNAGNYISENQYTLEPEFLAGSLTPNSIYASIEQYKLESNGNYDAIYGIVTNFDWTFGEDGSYDITVKLISKGDIIESIKSAVLVSETTNTEEPKSLTFEDFQQSLNTPGQSGIRTTSVFSDGFTEFQKAAREQNAAKAATTSTSITPSTSTTGSLDPIAAIKDAHTIGRLYYNVQQLLKDLTNPNVANDFDYLTQIYTSPEDSSVKPYFSQTYQTPKDSDNSQANNSPTKFYIRLGSLLAFIQTNLVPKEKQGGTLYPSINIDYDVNNNLAYTNDFQISADPNVCLINTTVKSKDGNQEFTFAKGASSYKKTIAGTKVGQIMNIYINFDTIIEIIGTNGDPKNQTSIYTLLEVLCNKLSVALGGINTFRPFIDTTTNTLKIIDESVLPNRNGISTALGGISTENDPVIQIYGYNYLRNPETNQITRGYAGFVKNFKFTSKLDPKFAQIISIGATSQGGIIGEDATAFSSLNKGLKDRIKPEIFASTGTSTNSEINIEAKTRQDQFKESLTNFENYVGQIGIESKLKNIPILNEAEISSYTNLYATFMQFIETKNAVSTKKSSGTIGFIPVSVGLTLDGISGLKLLNGIKVDTSYLPSNYPETMLFIISKLAHKIENNIWTTELETIMTPKDVVSSVSGSLNGETSRRTSSGNSGSGSGSGNSSGSGPYFRGSVESTLEETVSFLTDVLKGLGISNPNQFQIQFMKSWRQHEGAKAAWNPFNTTKTFGTNEPIYNYATVRNYATREEGLKATIYTLNLSYYTEVIKAIKAIKDENGITAAIVAVNNSPWGSKFNPPTASAWKTLNNLIWKSPIVPR
jgi:hypothetical protein